MSREDTHQPRSHALQVSRVAYLEEEPDDEDLQTCHAHHHQALDDREVEYPPLRAPDGGEVPVLARPEVLLVARDGGELAGELEDRFFKRGRLFWGRALLGGDLGVALFVLDLFVHIY